MTSYQPKGRSPEATTSSTSPRCSPRGRCGEQCGKALARLTAADTKSILAQGEMAISSRGPMRLTTSTVPDTTTSVTTVLFNFHIDRQSTISCMVNFLAMHSCRVVWQLRESLRALTRGIFYFFFPSRGSLGGIPLSGLTTLSTGASQMICISVAQGYLALCQKRQQSSSGVPTSHRRW